MRIGFLIDDSRSPSSEEVAAWEFLSAQQKMTSKRVRFSRLGSVERLRQSYDVLWWHSSRDPLALSEPRSEKSLKTIHAFIEKGGSVLFSLAGAAYVCDLGIESVRPAVVSEGTWTEESWAKDYPDIRGFATFQGHPIFQGMTGGLYSWMPAVGRKYSSAIYDGTVPASGKVVAVERLYIKVIPSRRLVTEYSVGRGRVLCVGSYMFFEENAPRVRSHLEQFTRNCFAFLTTPKRRLGRTTYWTFDPSAPRSIGRKSAPLTVRDKSLSASSVGPVITRSLSADSPGEAFDVGGRRCVVLGQERRGIQEVWCHPLRALKNVRIGFSAGTDLVWSETLPADVEIRPEMIVRRFTLNDAAISERTFTHPELASGCIQLSLENGSSLRVHATAEVDLRLMWPLDEYATGALTYAWDEGLRAAVVSTISGEFASIFGVSIPPRSSYVGNPVTLEVSPAGFHASGEDPRVVRVGITIEISQEHPSVIFGFAASSKSERDAELAYRETMRHPLASLSTQVAYMSQLQSGRTTIEVSDPVFNDAYRWALVGTDRFYLDTYGLGASYVAGFGTVERGWDGGHKVSGRPGYAWYFGRDAVWTSFASLEYGDFEKVKGVLDFLGRHQDISGKILHELTTSGFSHFDAADATPLYIMLLGRYVRASGHKSFARGEFARLRKAVEFCYSTDTDGDGLIENTNVGHGWVEGGALFPVHTEHYLACVWREALREAAYVAGVCGHPQLAKKWIGDSDRVRAIVEKDFWNPETKFIRFGKRADGTYSEEKTLLPAVGLLLGIGTKEQADPCLHTYASSDFSTDWGTRIIGASNPLFKPTGYHYGSVWPLFTGWAALAAFKWNRPLQGYMQTMSTALTFKHFSAGYIEEVMRGDVFEPSGVCPHQAWSESMVLEPLLEGMLGIQADGMKHELQLSPWIPPQWSSFSARRIRVGQSYVSFEVERGESTTSVRFTLDGRQPVTMSFAMRFPLGTNIEGIEKDGKLVAGASSIRSYEDAPVVTLRITSRSTLTFKHRGGIGIVPPLPDVRPGQASRGLRVLDERLEGGIYSIELEGPAGSQQDLEVIHRGAKLGGVEGATIIETYVGRSRVRVEFAKGDGYSRGGLRFRAE